MASKTVEFDSGFIESITAGGVERSDALRSSTLVDVIKGRTGVSETFKSKRIALLNTMGMGDITLGDLSEKTARRTDFINALAKIGNTNETKGLIGDFKGLFAEVGVTAAMTTNPFRNAMKETLGAGAYEKLGFSTDIERLLPVDYPPEAYRESKRISGALLTSKDPVRRAAGARMLLMMMGGYRPSDFKALRIENIDFEKGTVQGLKLKTDGTGKVKSIGVGYLPSLQRDVIKELIGDKSSGLVFEKPSVLDKLINEELKNANIPLIEYTQESTGQNIKQAFSAYDFRRIKETDLEAKGYNENSVVRKALTWRPPAGNVQKYQAVISQSGVIEAANARGLENYILLSEGNLTTNAEGKAVKTHGQFLADVGVKNISPVSQRYVVTANAIDELPIHLQDQVANDNAAVTFSDKPLTRAKINVDQNAAGEYVKLSSASMEQTRLQIEADNRRAAAEMPPEPPKPMTEEPQILSSDDMSDTSKKALGGGFDFDAFVKGKAKTIVAALTGGATFGALMEDAGAVVRDVAIETALTAAKAPLSVAGALPMILEPSSRMAGPELTQPSREEQDMARTAMEPSDMLMTEGERIEDMERMAIADAGFVSRNREPEAAPASEAGFITR